MSGQTRAALKDEQRAAARGLHPGYGGASADRAHDTPQVSALCFALISESLKAVRKSDWST